MDAYNSSILTVEGTQPFMGHDIPIVLGGFGPGAKCVCDKTVAEIHGMEAKNVRARITDNLRRFRDKVDYLDLKEIAIRPADNNPEAAASAESQRACEASTSSVLDMLGYSKQAVTQASHIYLLSERGYGKLVKIMDTDQAWDIYEHMLDEYFCLRDGGAASFPAYPVPKNYSEALRMLADAWDKEQEQTKQIAVMKPKADYCDVILQCKETVPITLIAKDYGYSAQKFNELLHAHHIQYRLGKTWFLYAPLHGLGYTQSATDTYEDGDGVIHAYPITHWTQDGRLFLYHKLKKLGILPVIEQEPDQISLPMN